MVGPSHCKQHTYRYGVSTSLFALIEWKMFFGLCNQITYCVVCKTLIERLTRSFVSPQERELAQAELDGKLHHDIRT